MSELRLHRGCHTCGVTTGAIGTSRSCHPEASDLTAALQKVSAAVPLKGHLLEIQEFLDAPRKGRSVPIKIIFGGKAGHRRNEGSSRPLGAAPKNQLTLSASITPRRSVIVGNGQESRVSLLPSC